MISDWELKTFEEAQNEAKKISTYAEEYLAIDRTSSTFPRYGIIKCPQVGDLISRSLNGDYYPDSKIKSISKNLRLIISESGKKYYRYKKTGSWFYNKCWVLINGHITRFNPEF